DLSRPDRLRTHYSAAHLLAGRSDVPASVIAQHMLDAGELGDPLAIARWAEASARAARRLRGHVEAARWALVAARHWAVAGDTERQGAMLAESVNDSITAGDGSRATELSGQLADLARRAGSGRLLARAALAR